MDPMRERWHLSRRRFLTSAASGLGAAALAGLLREEGLLAAGPGVSAGHFPGRATACIFIFLGGGASQPDMFDPKPEVAKRAGEPLPESFRKNMRFAFISPDSPLRPSGFKFSRHGECGMDFSELLPHTARHADDICMIRSLHAGAFNHLPAHLLMNTGYDVAGYPSVGSWVTYGLGSVSQNLPGYVVLTTGRVTGGQNNYSNAFLPTRYQGVELRSEGPPIVDLENPAGVTDAAHRQSLDSIKRLARLRAGEGPPGELDSTIARYELAFRMQAAAPELIDIDSEPAYLREAYGVDDPEREGREAQFSRNCLLARRLVERGVRFVTLYDGGWDQHGNLHERLTGNCRRIDRPVAALLGDLKQRGLLDQTLVVFSTEFGRTPISQGDPNDPNAGRDHHPYAFTAWMAGGGGRGGHIHGATDEFGWRPTEDPVHLHDFHATLLHMLGLDHKRLTYTTQGRAFRLTDVHGNVVHEVIG